jgi:hypothetical protein
MIDPMSVPSTLSQADDKVLHYVDWSTTIPEISAQNPPIPAEGR